MNKLTAMEIRSGLGTLPDWKKKRQALTRTFDFDDFPGAMQFVNGVARVAEKMQHHPDIDIRWNRVTLTVTTHDAGGLTEKDFELAKKADQLDGRCH